jgi:hypothetical protein
MCSFQVLRRAPDATAAALLLVPSKWPPSASETLQMQISANHETRSLPLRPGGAENCNITFFEGRGVKNVILQYSILREKCNLTFFGTMGKLKKCKL